MADDTARNRRFVVGAIIISVLILGAWFGVLADRPACGPPGNTRRAHVDRWAPWAFIVGEFVALSLTGIVFRRTLVLIAVVLATVGGVAILGGALIVFANAAHAGCFS